jgi:lycopene beta-cyclase
VFDALVIGTGPAGLCMAAALCREGLRVMSLSPQALTTPWVNTYGIWRDELTALDLTQLLSHQWENCVVYAGEQRHDLPRQYGLFDRHKLQTYFLDACPADQHIWQQGIAAQVRHHSDHSTVTTTDGVEISARIVIDASGHKATLIQRPATDQVAYQAAYGIVGRFSKPPIEPHQFVFMDYRGDHLSPAERLEPPTFLYAMDLGDGVFFVEETSLAYCPAISFDVLEKRLHQRLTLSGIDVTETHHVERCLFPMNLPLPDLHQPIVGFGGAASMVHPASGYLVGAMLRRAPGVAEAIAQTLNSSTVSPGAIAESAWRSLWSQERLRKHYLYLFGLKNLMRFNSHELNDFFATFFHLPRSHWSGFLMDSLTMPELLQAMLILFSKAPNHVRLALMRSVFYDGGMLWNTVFPNR